MIIPTMSLERQAEALARAQQHWKKQNEKTDVWTIALTREAGTDAAGIGHEVGKRLGWPTYDRELIERIANEMGLRSNLLETVDERRRSWLAEAVESFSSARSVSESKFVKHLVGTLLSLGEIGHCVIVGRGAVHVLPRKNTLRVRLVGEKESRILAAQRRYGMPADEAARWVERTDQERNQFIKEHFGKDPCDTSNYDLVINTSRFTEAECADMIVKALKNLEARAEK